MTRVEGHSPRRNPEMYLRLEKKVVASHSYRLPHRNRNSNPFLFVPWATLDLNQRPGTHILAPTGSTFAKTATGNQGNT